MRDIIDALRSGTVPKLGLSELAVGIDSEISAICESLDYARDGKTTIRFIRGEYGSGKTFLCDFIREEAFKREFVVSWVTVSPDHPLGKVSKLYPLLVDSLRMHNKRDACAAADLLEKWQLSMVRHICQVEGLELRSRKDVARIRNRTVETIRENFVALHGFDPSVCNALISFFNSRATHDSAQTNRALGWLKGSVALPAVDKKAIGVKGNITDLDTTSVLELWLHITRETGLSGWLIILDEVETVRRLPYPAYREQAYETLRVLLDAAGENSLPGAVVIVTGTPELFEDRKFGIPSYEALYDRIREPIIDDEHVNYQQPVLILRGLDKEKLLSIALRVRSIHAKAYSWEPNAKASDEIIDSAVNSYCYQFGRYQRKKPREFLRMFVDTLDRLHQHDDVRFEDFMSTDEDGLGS